MNTVGIFGVASASYYLSRVGSAIGRLCQYISGTPARTWHLLVANDYHSDAGGPRYRESINVFFVLCSVLGVPLSWRKTSGGDTVSWVGFELLHRSYKIGLSERRSRWFQTRTVDWFIFRLSYPAQYCVIILYVYYNLEGYWYSIVMRAGRLSKREGCGSNQVPRCVSC